MVRPHASENSKDLATLFAKTITTEVRGIAPASSSVGRSGEHSIFEALSVCFPHASRDHTRTGVSLVELNKALEKEGFMRVRFRNSRRRGQRAEQQGGRKWRDPDNQSFYRYGCRRWRDPEDPTDFEFLSSVWPQINELAPVKCQLADILQYLRNAIASDMDSEVIQRKMVGLSSTALSQATTPSCGSPVSMISSHEAEGGFEQSDHDGDSEVKVDVFVKDECWDALEVFGGNDDAVKPVPSFVALDNSWPQEIFPSGFELAPGPDFESFMLAPAEQPATDLSCDGLMTVFTSGAPALWAGW